MKWRKHNNEKNIYKVKKNKKLLIGVRGVSSRKW